MTDESHGDIPDETPLPPTSTRWSEDAAPGDDAPAPPFVPGRQDPGPAHEAGVKPAVDEEPAVEGEASVEKSVDEEPAVGPREEAAPGDDLGEDDFPYERFDIEGRAAETTAEPAEEVQDAVWTPADLGVDEPEPSEAVPKPVPASAPAPEREPEPEPALAPGEVGAPDEATEDVAALLERIARLLRTEGEGAVRAEMESSDRLTALVAGLVAGYLSGRS